ncbi:MAG: response regulator transcription factor [Breznakibacter sp.]
MDKITVLLVEDEPTLSMIIRETLEEKGEFTVYTAPNGQQGLQRFHALHPDIVVADVMMPEVDGFDMVRQIRQTDLRTPVLFLTSRSAVDDVVRGFRLGGNDYLKKPFGMNELIIRIKALLDRAFVKAEQCDRYQVGRFSFDPVAQYLLLDSKKTPLSNRESELLRRLCENKSQIIHTRNLLLDLWGDDGYFTAKSLHVFITKLRQKLSKDPSVCIINVRGTGYKLIEDHG